MGRVWTPTVAICSSIHPELPSSLSCFMFRFPHLCFLGSPPNTADIQILVSMSDSGGPRLGRGIRVLDVWLWTTFRLQSYPSFYYTLHLFLVTASAPQLFMLHHYTSFFLSMEILNYQIGIQRPPNLVPPTSYHTHLPLHSLPARVYFIYTVLLSILSIGPSKAHTSLLLHKSFAVP